MTRANVQMEGAAATVRVGEEADILIKETDEQLVITIPKHLTVAGLETKNGNLTLATTHGNVTLPSGVNLSVNCWQRGGTSKPKRNVTIK